MAGKLSTRLAAAHGFVAKLWKLTAPYFWSEERWSARGLLAIVVGSGVFLVYLAKLLNEWNARFFNALQDKDVDAFWAELRYFVIIAFIFIVVAVYRLWFRQMLQIRWRRWLTAVYYRDWLAERTYYRMELTGALADNPEQRIEDDCNVFTDQTLVILLDLLSQILMASTYPIEIVQADRWVKAHKNLKGEALAKELGKQSWDASVKSLVNVPDVLAAMSEKLDWTVKIGDAFLADQKAVLDTVQKLR